MFKRKHNNTLYYHGWQVMHKEMKLYFRKFTGQLASVTKKTGDKKKNKLVWPDLYSSAALPLMSVPSPVFQAHILLDCGDDNICKPDLKLTVVRWVIGARLRTTQNKPLPSCPAQTAIWWKSALKPSWLMTRLNYADCAHCYTSIKEPEREKNTSVPFCVLPALLITNVYNKPINMPCLTLTTFFITFMWIRLVCSVSRV